MDIQAVDLQLLKALLTPELKLAPGRAIMARVVQAQTAQARGALSIAGMVIEAELPKKLAAGDEVRLLVRDVASDKVTLSLSQESPTVAPPPAVPLPGGGQVHVTEREAQPGGEGGATMHALAIRYDAPALGAVDLRFALDTASLKVTVSVAAGAAHQAATAKAAELGEALSAALGRAISVSVAARQDPVDVYV